MNKVLLIVLLLIITCESYAEIYQWTDSQGVIHFSDTPHEGATKLKLPDFQTYSAPSIKQDTPPPDEDNLGEKQDKYKKIAILQPLNESTIRNNQGFIPITILLEPNLSPGDKLQIIVDGAPLGDPQPNLNFELSGIERGTHTIAVQVVNANGGVILSTDTITIYMQRPRVGMATHNGS